MRTWVHLIRLLCAMALLLVSFRVLALNAYLQPERIYEGDIASLVLQYESDIPSLYALDTTALEQDFEIIDAQSRIHRIKDPMEPGLRMEWIVQIAPRQAGSIQVPAIRLGEHVSNPLQLEVEPRPQSDRRDNDVSLEMEVLPASPYLGQQAIVTIRLVSNVPLINGRISEPEAGQNRIFTDREDRHYSMTREGRDYQVLERQFSLFVDQDEPLHLGTISFRGQLQHSPNRQILRKSDPIHLPIRSKPGGYGDQAWLPAENLEIIRRWEDLDGPIEVGQSLGFTLDISARGLAGETLPVDLASQEDANFRIYPDEAMTFNEFEADSIVGRMQQSFVFVASRPGFIDVPAITLYWWDTGSDRLREAKLPGRRIESIDPATTSGNPLSGSQESFEFETTQSPRIAVWVWIVLSLLTGVFIPFKRKSLMVRLLECYRLIREIRASEVVFRQACFANDPLKARNRLIQLARQCWREGNFYGLRAIAEKLGNDAFTDEVARLDAAIFGKEIPAWQGERLWHAYVKGKQGRAGSAASSPSVLPHLYPVGFRRRHSPNL